MIENYKDKIYTGLIVKNYTEMLSILNEKNKRTHDKRVRQEDEWHRYFNWERDGNKFIITEVYDNVPEFINSKKSKYMNYFGYILLELLEQNDGEICLFKNILAKIMCIKTNFYIEYADENFFDDAVEIVNNAINIILNSCLKQMEDKGLIKIGKMYVEVKTSQYTGKTIFEELNSDEQNIYIGIEEDMFSEYAMEHHLNSGDIGKIKKHLTVRRNWSDHYRNVNERIKRKLNKEVRVKTKISLIEKAIYDVNPDTVYDDLNAAINKRLIEVAEKYSGDDKAEILKIAELNSITYVPQRTITQSEIDELETVYKDCAWDNNDEVVPDDFEFYESKHKNKRMRRCLDDYA